MTNVKNNFKSMFADITCNYCDEGVPQTDLHLLDCAFFIDACPQLQNNNTAEYEDIFMEDEAQIQVTKIRTRRS